MTVLDHWFCGDEDAIRFAHLLWNVTQDWDDVIDEGDVSKANGVYQWIAFGMEREAFFQRNATWLRPVLLQMYLNWRDANVLERSSPDDARKAWMLRAGIYGVFSTMAWLVGGEAHSRTVGPEIWRAYGETEADILTEFAHA